MTAEALLVIAEQLEVLAKDKDMPVGVGFELVRLAKQARLQAGGQEESDVPIPLGSGGAALHGICRGDVLALPWEEEHIPQADRLYKVVRVHRREKRVTVVSINGTQFTRPACEFAHRWPRIEARKLPIRWRFDPAY